MKIRRFSVLSVVVPLVLVAGPAGAADRWEEAGSGAVAILPKPVRANAVVGGSLACAEQAWSFRLRAEGLSQFPAEGASIAVDGEKIPGEAEFASGVITIPIAFESLDPLRDGSTLAFAFGRDKSAPGATFSLRGSRKVLDAIAPRCSQIDMTAYSHIDITETDPAVGLARPLLAEEAALFRAATNKEPALAAATIALPQDRAMLFATLCGSTWYYGRSGCTLTGFVRETATADWRLVYNSEGVALYTDPGASNGGWPNLVTLPVTNGVERSHFIWTGLAYEQRDHIVAEEDPLVEGQGDIAQ